MEQKQNIINDTYILYNIDELKDSFPNLIYLKFGWKYSRNINVLKNSFPKLKELYAKKDYGQYADKNGKLRVAFIASNHTTGGNSGSPVLNAKGELIGTNFDRAWEGTMSDINYDPEICRNVMVDIRYVLFIIDKYAEAKNIMSELSIVR